MLPTCAKCGRDSLQHRNPRLRHAFVSKDDTVRELKSHIDHLVAYLKSGQLHKADFHARNAQGCLDELKLKITRAHERRELCDNRVQGCTCNQFSSVSQYK